MVDVFRAGVRIAEVMDTTDNDPAIVMVDDAPTELAYLTFNDLAIIQDNWNQLEEMQKTT